MISGIADWHETVYTQRMFRVLLASMSRPGSIQSAEHLPHPAPYPALYPISHSAASTEAYHSALLGVALTLLDQEVSYALPSPIGDLASRIRGMTMARHVRVEEADYVFIRGGEPFDVTRLRRGSFLDPEQGATVICQVNAIHHEPAAGGLHLRLRGPGIPETRTLSLSPLHPAVLDSWVETNQEFPMGLDWIFVDLQGQIGAVPRSTAIVREVI